MCLIALNPNGPGKLYLVDESLADIEAEHQAMSGQRAADIRLSPRGEAEGADLLRGLRV
jgi:hypothetical protein